VRSAPSSSAPRPLFAGIVGETFRRKLGPQTFHQKLAWWRSRLGKVPTSLATIKISTIAVLGNAILRPPIAIATNSQSASNKLIRRAGPIARRALAGPEHTFKISLQICEGEDPRGGPANELFGDLHVRGKADICLQWLSHTFNVGPQATQVS